MVEPLFKKVDCLRIPVPDLEAGLAFYRDHLGHTLCWRSDKAAGLCMSETDSEIVLHIEEEHDTLEIDLLVSSAEAAAFNIVEAGGSVVVPLFDVEIGRCVVVQDPWHNQLVLLDMSKGPLQTDADGTVISREDTEALKSQSYD